MVNTPKEQVYNCKFFGRTLSYYEDSDKNKEI
jgi:hypothetical protein